MKHHIKIHIKKRKTIGHPPTPWVRFEVVDKILLDESSSIKTEQQLCKYIFRQFGTGRYQLLAWQKGYEGFWMFWLGDIYDNGYMRDIRKNKELEKLKGALVKAQSYEEREELEDDMQFEREIFEIDKKSRRKGPILIKTTRPGVLQSYEDILI